MGLAHDPLKLELLQKAILQDEYQAISGIHAKA